MKPFTPCGHAFVVIDSIFSVDACATRFKNKPKSYYKHLQESLISLRQKFAFQESARGRNMSTFIKAEEVQEKELESIYEETVLAISKVTEPSDILWKHMTGMRGLFIYRRIFLTILSISVLVFISSPATLLSSIRRYDKNKYLEFDWVDKDNVFIGSFVRQHGPPFLIILINQLLMILIDLTTRIECYETHSLYQRAIYLKSVIYLNLNMLIIPTLSLSQGSNVGSIWDYLSNHRDMSVTQVLGEFYLGNSGTFFVSLVIQNAFMTSAFYILNITELMNSYGSPWLAHFQRQVFRSQEPWLRKEDNTFYYGLLYAYLMAIYAICIFFSGTVPLLTMACMIYAVVRHGVDALNLITVYRKEIDSQGHLISDVTNTVIILVLAY